MTDTTRTEPEAVPVTINGTAIEAKPGELLIDAAERHGVYIPRFCYHPRMRPVGMCRMCLVEVDTGRGPALQPSCMIPVAPGMTVDTESEATRKAQDGVLEFLLLNHPLDCPVCDKGGECPLQDQTLAFGPGESRMVEQKRHFEKPIPISDLVYLDRERCILCDRCTRFADEVAGDPLITFVDRGDHTQVNTFPDQPFASYFSGNTVQLCPVGALTAVPYRFRARPWDLEQVESTCTFCSVGCRIAVQSSTNRLVRHLGVDVDPVNWGWLCDKGRFGFEGVNSDDRLGRPLVRAGDTLAEATWAEALEAAAGAIRAGLDAGGPGAVAVLGGARLTNEDAYAWAKLAKSVVGTDNVDAQIGDGLPAEVVLGLPRATIDEVCAARTVVLLGPDLKEELPVLYLRLRDAAVEKGVRIVEVSPHDTGLTEVATVALRHRPGEAAAAVRAALDGAGDDPRVARAAELLAEGDVAVVLGRPSLAEAPDAVVAAASLLAARLPGVRFLPVLRRANVHGALDLGLAPGVLPGRVDLDAGRPWFEARWGAVPASRGLDATGILTAAAEGAIETLVLLGADPLRDFPDARLAQGALERVPRIVAVDCFLTESSRRAHVVLPAAAFGERSGTTTNIEGRVSVLNQKVTPPGTARADWMIAVELAHRLGADLGLDSLDGIWAEIESVAPAHAGLARARLLAADGLDGVVVPLSDHHEAGADRRPLAQTEAPEVTAADTHMGPESVATTLPGGETVPSVPRSPSGASGATMPEQIAEAAAAGDAAREAEAPEEAAALEAAAQQAAVEAATEDAGEGDVSAPVEHGPDRPPLLAFEPVEAGPAPPVDAYSLRLVSGRKLYDQGTLVQHAPSLAGLAPGAHLRVNPYDLDRLGLHTGDGATLRSARGSVVVEVEADPGVARGSALLPFNQPGVSAAALIDATARVTEVRLETRAGGGGA